MKKLLNHISRHIDARDIFVGVGLAMVGHGLSAIYPPAAWVCVGATLFWIGARR